MNWKPDNCWKENPTETEWVRIAENNPSAAILRVGEWIEKPCADGMLAALAKNKSLKHLVGHCATGDYPCSLAQQPLVAAAALKAMAAHAPELLLREENTDFVMGFAEGEALIETARASIPGDKGKWNLQELLKPRDITKGAGERKL